MERTLLEMVNGQARTQAAEASPWLDLGVVEPFVESLDSIPARAVIRTVETQCRMLERDLLWKRVTMNDTVGSVLAFNRFLGAVMHGLPSPATEVPDAHHAAYRKTVGRLIAAGQLPVGALAEFEHAFFGATLPVPVASF